MTDKQIIIDDQKKTIHRLQDECTEKTNTIIALGEQLQAKEQECEELKDLNTRLDNQRETYWKGYQKLKQTLTEIKELCQKHIKAEKIVMANDILQKISECEGNDE